MTNQALLQRTERWINSYKESEKTRKLARTSYNSLIDYLDDQNITITQWVNQMKTTNDARYTALEDWMLSSDLMPATIKAYYSFIRKYLRKVHEIKIDREDQKDIFKLPKPAKIERKPLQKDTIKLLCKNCTPYYRTLFLILSSSGMRISECLALTPDKIEWNEDPVKITIDAHITKTNAERITFISSEAFNMLEKNADEFFQPHPLNTVEVYFWRLRKKLGLTERYHNSRNYHTNIHSFRAFFRTQSGKVNRDFAESVLGHEGYLKQYVRLDDSEKAAYYKKTEPKLRIF